MHNIATWMTLGRTCCLFGTPTCLNPYRFSFFRCSLFILCLGVLMTTAGCKAITKYECNKKDWQKVGYKLGAAGKGAEDPFSRHSRKCEASGTSIDKAVFLDGHTDGLKIYCVYDTAFQDANSGEIKNEICGTRFGNDFEEGYSQGIAELCTTSGGERMGEEPSVYRGTCPADSQRTFLESYIAIMEKRTLPDAEARVSTHESQSTVLQSSITLLDIQIEKFDRLISAAKKLKDPKYEARLREGRNAISEQRQPIQNEKYESDRLLASARKTATRSRHMIRKWKPKLTQN